MSITLAAFVSINSLVQMGAASRQHMIKENLSRTIALSWNWHLIYDIEGKMLFYFNFIQSLFS